MQQALVDQAHRLVGEAGGQGADLEAAAAVGTARRQQGALRTDHVVQGVEDGGALDQNLPVVQHQGRDAAHRIERRHLVGVGPDRPRPVLVGEAVETKGDRGAADEGGVVLADEDHASA